MVGIITMETILEIREEQTKKDAAELAKGIVLKASSTTLPQGATSQQVLGETHEQTDEQTQTTASVNVNAEL